MAEVGRKWRNFGGAGAESRTIDRGSDPACKSLAIDTNNGGEDNRSRLWGPKKRNLGQMAGTSLPGLIECPLIQEDSHGSR